ncbi:MAG: hypothetical protein PHI85_02555 [Victivallaceae bacterium]|nr:hypothetical protein [Victivallaceae bacterium]
MSENSGGAEHFWQKTYQRGTLVYTLPKLALVFIWMMVGFLVFNVCTTLPAKMLPIQLEHLGASDTSKMIVLTTIGGILNMTVCPYVGFVSDRHRGRWGRRIPYILFSLPFICVSLLLFAFTDRIGPWFAGVVAPLTAASPVTMTVLAIAIVMFMYQFYYMYVGSVIHYIANDIIPKEFFGQIIAAINIAVCLGNTLFAVLLYRHAARWYNEIFIGGAIVYGVGMLLMCLFVKEGEYPPLEGEAELQGKTRSVGAVFKNWLHGILIFIRESFSHRLYLLRYLLTALGSVAGVVWTYTFFLRRELQLDLAAMGKTDGYSGLINLCAYFLVLFVFGVLVSRWHPVRIVIYNVIIGFAGTFIGCRWIFGTLSSDAFIYSTLILVAAQIPQTTIGSVAGMPFEMLTFPRSRFGSFCSMQALVRSCCVTLAGLVVGMILDQVKGFCPEGSTVYYRYISLWPLAIGVFQVAAAFCLYREWNRLGGYKNYACPAPWSKEGMEKIEQPECRLPSAKYLKLAFRGFDFLMVMTLGLVGFWTVWYLTVGDRITASLFLVLCGSLALGGLLCWLFVRIRIMRDVRRCLAGESPKNGIPHHGMLLLVIPYYIVNTAVTVYYICDLPPANGAYFMALFCVVNIVLVCMVYLLSVMERGIVTAVEK